jgi:hypothetical protein
VNGSSRHFVSVAINFEKIMPKHVHV